MMDALDETELHDWSGFCGFNGEILTFKILEEFYANLLRVLSVDTK